jgi:hypothetical protein
MNASVRRGWLKNGNPPGDPSKAARCGAGQERARHAEGRRCTTEDAECTVVHPRALALQKDSSDAAGPI